MAATTQQQNSTTTTTAAKGPIDDRDVQDWTRRFNEVLAKPSEVVNSRSPAGAQPWYASLFGCFNPLDLCVITYCLPCVTFGKTHHRLHKSGSLDGYEPINTSCLLFCGSTCCALHWVPLSMQRAEARRKYNLEGTCLVDLATSCCCGCCSLVQQEKEAAHREPLLRAGTGVTQEYKAPGGMEYKPAAAAAVPAATETGTAPAAAGAGTTGTTTAVVPATVA